MTTNENRAPKHRMTVGGQELFMSYAMLQRLIILMPTPEQALMVVTQSEMIPAILTTLFSKYGKDGENTEIANLDNIQITPSEALEVVSWVSEHILYFFVQSLNQLRKMDQNFLPVVEEMKKELRSQQLPTGSSD